MAEKGGDLSTTDGSPMMHPMGRWGCRKKAAWDLSCLNLIAVDSGQVRHSYSKKLQVSSQDLLPMIVERMLQLHELSIKPVYVARNDIHATNEHLLRKQQ